MSAAHGMMSVTHGQLTGVMSIARDQVADMLLATQLTGWKCVA